MPDPPDDPIDTMDVVPDPLPAFIIQPVVSNTVYNQAIAIEMADDGNPILLAANGVFRSETNGDTWTPVRTVVNNYLSDLAKTTDGNLFAVFKNEGLSKSTDDGKTWNTQIVSNIDFAIPFNDYKLVAANDGDLFFLQFRHFTEEPRLYHSIDGGATFSEVTNLPDFGGDYNVMEFEAGANGSVLLATAGGFFKTEDDGQNWIEIADFTDVRDLYITPGGLAFFRRAMTSVTLKGMDDGSNWTTMPIYGNVIGYNADGHLVLSGWLNDNKNIFRSTDNGENWLAYGFQENQLDGIAGNANINLSIGAGKMYFNYPWDVVWGSFQLPAGAIRDLIFHNGKWIVATPKSIHVSEDNGKTWERSYYFNPNQFDSANRLAIRKSDNKIMVGSLNGDAKIFLFDENVTTIEQVINFNTLAIVTGLTQDEEGRTMVALGDHEGNGISFLQTGWNNTWAEETLPHPTPYAYIHDFHYNGNGIVYASFEHEFGKTGISFFLMQVTTGGVVTSDWDIENGYQTDQMILKTFAIRNLNGSNLFVGIDNVDRIWFSRGGQWKLHGDANIGEVYKIRFDDAGFLYLMTANGVFKTSAILK
jgi:photosystem II stability/assembly factor-like uncharacterized protein